MSTVTHALIYIIETLTSLFLLFVLLRFMLQLARADFYNPISQAIVKITNPVLLPLRKVIPGLFGIDVASLLLALAIQVIFGEAVALIAAGTFVNPGYLLIWGFLATLMFITYILIGGIIILVVSSFVAPYSTHPVLSLTRQLMQPLLAPIQRIIPPMGGLDFSVLFFGMGIYVLQIFINGFAGSLRLNPFLVLGI